MKIAISAESAIDMPEDLLKQFNIFTTPLWVNMGGTMVADKEGLSSEIFDYVNRTGALPKTAGANPEQLRLHFEKLKEDYDAIVHVSISSALSSTYNNACLVAKEMENVYVVDSKTLSTGIALLCIYARELADKGYEPEKIYKLTQEKASEVQVHFILEKLNYLYKGGRCSALALFGANVLKIKPRISLINGKMVVTKKYRGDLTKVIAKYADEYLESFPNPETDMVFLTSSSQMEEARVILREKLKAKGFKHIYETLAGGSISCHCGENCLGILFFSKAPQTQIK